MPTSEEKLQGHMDRNPQLDKNINHEQLNVGKNAKFEPVEKIVVGTKFKPLRKKGEGKKNS